MKSNHDDDAVGWHSAIAVDFANKYASQGAFMERREVWSKLIDQHFADGDLIADLGCGSGEMLVLASRVSSMLIGIDASAEMIELTRSRLEAEGINDATLIHGDITEYSRSDLDGILLSSVIEYIRDLDLFFAKTVFCLKPGSRVVVSAPNRRSLFRVVEGVFYRIFRRPKYRRYVVNMFTIDELRALFEGAGFKVLETQFYGQAPIFGRFFRVLGLKRCSDTLCVIVAEKSESFD